jgi:preprotein translocase subunit YajC
LTLSDYGATQPPDFERLEPMQAMQPMLMMLVIFGIFYFVLIRPQVKRQRETQSMLSKLGAGDEIVTRGGIIGKITGVTADNTVLIVEIQDKVRVRIPRAFVEAKWDGKVTEATGAKSAA